VDVRLMVGVLNQEVQVLETAPLLHSSDASMGEVVDQEHASELSLSSLLNEPERTSIVPRVRGG